MKALVSKTIIAGAVAAASLFAGVAAQAATFNPFTVNPPGTSANFNADKITGNYTEVATFNPDGTFNVSLYWKAGQFATNGGNTGLDGGDTGLGNEYGLYATYMASGTVTHGTSSETGQPTTVFTFKPSSTGGLSFFLDYPRNDPSSGVVAPTSGSGMFTVAGSADDTLLATGKPVSGQGTLDPSLSTCDKGGNINCGSFGSSTTFNLTAAGSDFFISPNPFYTMSFESGQLNNFNPSGTQVINGSLDVVFGNEVPEPASLALLGLGLLGLGVARRRKQ